MANMWKKVERIEMKRYQDAAKALHPRGGGGGGGGSSRSEEQVYQALTNETRHEDVNYASLKKTEENDLANNKGESVEPQGILKSSPPPSRDSSIKIHCSAVVCVTVSVMGGVVVILLAAALAVLSVEVFSHSSLTGSPSNGPFLSSIMGQLRRLNQTLSAMNKQQNNHSAALEELRTLSSFLENTSLRNAKTLEAEQKRIQDVWVTVNNTDLRTSALSGNTLLMNCSTTTTNKSIPILAFFNNGLYSISVLTSFENDAIFLPSCYLYTLSSSDSEYISNDSTSLKISGTTANCTCRAQLHSRISVYCMLHSAVCHHYRWP